MIKIKFKLLIQAIVIQRFIKVNWYLNLRKPLIDKKNKRSTNPFLILKNMKLVKRKFLYMIYHLPLIFRKLRLINIKMFKKI